jgi:16S rRNA processing protein RimM
MTEPTGRLEVGRIGRPHGVRGALYLDLVTDRSERVAPGARLWAGRWLTVTSSRPVQHRYVVTFDGVDDRRDAELLVGRVIEAEPLDDPDELWVHELIGATVVEGDVIRGRCVAVVANPAHDLLELDSGALVPVTFVTSFTEGIITIDAPEGLFDL